MTETVNESAEDALVERAARGDQRAFAVLVERYQAMVYSMARRLLRDPAGAEDAAQNAFIKAWAALPGFQRRSRFSSWLYRICYNTCISVLRRQQPVTDLESVEPAARTGPRQEFQLGSVREAIHEEIDRLPVEYRTLLTLYHFNGMKYDEIARTTHRPMGTVKAMIHRARLLLRSRLIERVGWDNNQEVMWR
jgi:RNA polymerase sigma-70 factor (ECF subfamily)